VKAIDDVPLFSERRYEDLAVGDRFGPFADELDAVASDSLRGAVGAHAPGESAPLGVLPLLTLRALRRALDGIIPGGVLIRQSFTVVDRLPRVCQVAVDVAVTAQQRRPSGFYTTFAFTVARGDAVAAVVEWMILAPPPSSEDGG
jgi:hypothetical protein